VLPCLNCACLVSGTVEYCETLKRVNISVARSWLAPMRLVRMSSSLHPKQPAERRLTVQAHGFTTVRACACARLAPSCALRECMGLWQGPFLVRSAAPRTPVACDAARALRALAAAPTG
jgi:hypothetical protein